jgi:hypothetical protein
MRKGEKVGMMEEDYISAKQKALNMNLDPTIYGTFAEIGAGQEVARIFFMAGGASGTVAKSMSAYDMVFSDAIYGKEPSGRYVCESRLKKMLEHEYELLLLRLGKQRGETTRFFAFANTVTAINFTGTNESHGWMGVRFQHECQAAPSDVLMHVRLLDRKNLSQQQALGIIGVNLLHACYYVQDKKNDFVTALMEDLGKERLEIDTLKVSGPAFKHLDPRILGLQLIKYGMAHALIFDPQGIPLPPSEVLYKKNVLALRSSFRPPTLLNVDMIQAGREHFLKEEGVRSEDVVVLCEMTLKNLRDGGELEEKDFLDRVDLLGALGHRVMVSNYHDYHYLASYLSLFTKKKMGFVLSVYNLEEIFDPDHARDLKGGILEGLGLIFNRPIHLYIYPSPRQHKPHEKNGEMWDGKSFRLEKSLHHLFDYFYENKMIQDLTNYDRDYVHIYSREVLEMIQQGKAGWEKWVPDIIAKRVKEYCLFGHPCNPQQKAQAAKRAPLFSSLLIEQKKKGKQVLGRTRMSIKRKKK